MITMKSAPTDHRQLVAIMFTDMVGCEPSPNRLPFQPGAAQGCAPAHGLLPLALADVALVC
jgi:hypothetical protein